MSEHFHRKPDAIDAPRLVSIAGRGPSPGPAGPGYEADSGNDEVYLGDYLRVLYKRRWVALTAFVVVLLGVTIYLLTAKRIYEARVQILIEKESANVVTFKEAYEQNQLTDDYYQTQYKILQSRAVARRTIDTLGLWNHAQFKPRSEDAFALSALAERSIRWATSLVSRGKSAEPPLPEETKQQSRTLDRFLEDLRVSPIGKSRLVDVRFRSPDPALAAQIANGLAKTYIEQNLEFKFTSSKEATDWLGDRLAEQRKQLNQSEQALQQYREKTDAVSLEERQNIVVQKLADLNAAVTRAKTERIQKETAFEQIRAVQNDRSAMDTLPSILSNTFIQQQKSELAELQRQQAQLSEKLGPRHPDMVRIGAAIQSAESKLQGEIGKVVQAMRNDYQQALAQERSLSSALEQQKREALDLNRKGIEYNSLARDAASNRQIFDSLMQRTKETGISGELKTSNIRVVDAAEAPRRPVSPNTRNSLLLALLSGMTLAIGLAFFFEYVDNSVKTPDEIKRHLGLPFLGMVPAVFDNNTPNPLISGGVPPNFSESFRALRTNLLFSSAQEGGKSIVVTSTAPGEGKTLVATNLAIALAQASQRVLLVDADMRKPRVHAMFGRSQQPGLSNVMVGNAKASESLWDPLESTCRHASLSIL